MICGPTDYDFIEGMFLIEIWCYTQSPHPTTFLSRPRGNGSDSHWYLLMISMLNFDWRVSSQTTLNDTGCISFTNVQSESTYFFSRIRFCHNMKKSKNQESIMFELRWIHSLTMFDILFFWVFFGIGIVCICCPRCVAWRQSTTTRWYVYLGLNISLRNA